MKRVFKNGFRLNNNVLYVGKISDNFYLKLEVYIKIKKMDYFYFKKQTLCFIIII